jgi:hypothetical protein
MHGARVFRLGIGGRRVLARRRKEALGIRAELLETALVAEIIGTSLVLQMTHRVVGRDGHAADGVEDFGRGGGMPIVRKG